MLSLTEPYRLTGLMSGTSLDGLDLANCTFWQSNGRWQYSIEGAETLPYSSFWQDRLQNLAHASAEELALADLELGELFGKAVANFLLKTGFKPQAIASHGHTIFHQPEKRFTWQIGNGWRLALASGYPVVNDFRSLDVARGGQGAPLVPIGDRLLFSDYTYCLNLGGIGNLSTFQQQKSLAFDFSPANMVLNALAKRLGKPYDAGGKLARSGKFLPHIFDRLNALDFYQQTAPKSLGYEWIYAEVMPLLQEGDPHDLLHTFCRHISYQLRSAIQPLQAALPASAQMLVTGGGAKNDFLMELFRNELQALDTQVIIPAEEVVDFKEALIFAFLGLLRLRGDVNCLASVTGANTDSVSGTVFEIL